MTSRDEPRAAERMMQGQGPLALPAATFVITYATLLLCIPSQLIVRPLGAPGTPANLWGVAALIWWVCVTLGGKNPVRGLTPARVSIAILVAAVTVSYAAGSLTGWYAPSNIHGITDNVYDLVPVTLDKLQDRMASAAGRGLLSAAGWAGILLLTADGLRSMADLDRVVVWLTRLGVFVAALGIVQFFTGYDIAALFQIPGLSANSDFGAVDTRSVLNRPSSTAVHPIEFGVVMSALFILALHRSLHTTRGWIGWIPTVVIGLALPLSVSRSAILSAGIALLVLFFGWPPRWRLRAMIIAPVAVVALRILVPGLVGTIRSLFTNLFNDPSISGRTGDYGVVLNLYIENPVFGRGLFTFVPQYYRILDNQLLLLLLELGAVGLIAFIVVISIGYFSARGARLRFHDPVHKHLGLALSATILGVTTSYVTFDALSFPMIAGITFLVLGLAGAAWRISLDDVPDTSASGRS